MGKHSAADGAVVHPIVPTALQQRARPDSGRGPTNSAVGWPQEPRRGGGVGWPTAPEPVTTGDDSLLEPAPIADDGSVLAVLDAAAQGVEAAPVSEPPPMRRSGWRRIFGGGGGGSPSAA